MLDILGYTLSKREQHQLANPLVGGVILFTRNFKDIAQLAQLIKDIRVITGTEFIIAVDHEGGRVQRFKQEFTHIPAMASIIQHTQGDIAEASRFATELGWLMASELLSIDIDISFAPVLDLDICSSVIGDRAFSSKPIEVIKVGQCFIDGMKQAGMKCTGKHFPGHGSVAADSHFEIPVDNRERNAIESLDMSVFKQLISQKKLDALMPAHVIYPAFDDRPAGFSWFWIDNILRTQLDFDGVIFSDDLGMEGATVAGNFDDRTKAALTAGCDMVLVCNTPQGAREVLAYLEQHYNDLLTPERRQKSVARLTKMLATTRIDRDILLASDRWHQAVAIADRIR